MSVNLIFTRIRNSISGRYMHAAQDCPPYVRDMPISMCGEELHLHSSSFQPDAGPGHMLAPETHLSQLTWSSAEGV